jgi:hypothetical protein
MDCTSSAAPAGSILHCALELSKNTWLLGGGEQQRRHGNAEHPGCLVVDHSSILHNCTTGRSSGFWPFRMRPV